MSKTFELIEAEKLLTSASSGDGYEFEDVKTPEVLRSVKVTLLAAGLGRIKSRVQGASASSDYTTERRRYIVLNKLLNISGIMAPRFRPSLSAGGPFGRDRTATDNLISNDHQVLDLHWLGAALGKSRPDRTVEERWQGLFDFGRGLDFSMAARFVGTVGSVSKKCAILGIPEDEQLQLRTIQTDAVRRFWQRQLENRENARAAVAAAARTNRQLKGKEVQYAHIAVAIACAEYTGYAADHWYEMITGEKIAASTLSVIRTRLPTLLAGSSPHGTGR